MNPVIVQCPHCRGQMQVDPRALTHQAACPFCRNRLIPSDHVVPHSSIAEQAKQTPQSQPFDFDDDAPRESRQHVRHRVEDSFGTGFGFAFGSTLGRAFGCLIVGICIVAVILGIGALATSK